MSSSPKLDPDVKAAIGQQEEIRRIQDAPFDYFAVTRQYLEHHGQHDAEGACLGCNAGARNGGVGVVSAAAR